MIYTTVYVSTLIEPLVGGELDVLLHSSRENNAALDISGMLAIRGRRVMQLLEGGEAPVRELFARIADDTRHHGVVKVWSSTHDHRRFPDWTMGFDDLEMAPDLASASANWPEPDWTQVPPTPGPAESDEETRDYVTRRAGALRRALVSGDRLVAALGIILHGHRPESVLDDDTVVRSRCAECRSFTTEDLSRYPCSTAKNAIWALEATHR